LYIIIDSENRVKALADTHIGMDGFTTVEVDIPPNHEIFSDPSAFIYADTKLVKDEEYVLGLLKNAKDKELNKACSETIVGGFNHIIDGVEYHFSYDMEAQMNFQGGNDVLSSGLVPSIEWTVSRDGVYERIPITKEIMNELKIVILTHKDGAIKKYRNKLMPLVYAAKTPDEVYAITWDSI
jgi:hypothetical protein